MRFPPERPLQPYSAASPGACVHRRKSAAPASVLSGAASGKREDITMKLDAAEVQEMIANDPHMLLVDVRSKEEYDAGHIPGAGCMAAEDICDCLYDEALGERGLDAIANVRGMELSDDASAIVLYCDNGERSARATEHMEAIGYVNVYDAGGLAEWPYEVVTTDEERAVAAALAASDAVAVQGDAGCGCGHAHEHSCGCDC